MVLKLCINRYQGANPYEEFPEEGGQVALTFGPHRVTLVILFGDLTPPSPHGVRQFHVNPMREVQLYLDGRTEAYAQMMVSDLRPWDRLRPSSLCNDFIVGGSAQVGHEPKLPWGPAIDLVYASADNRSYYHAPGTTNDYMLLWNRNQEGPTHFRDVYLQTQDGSSVLQRAMRQRRTFTSFEVLMSLLHLVARTRAFHVPFTPMARAEVTLFVSFTTCEEHYMEMDDHPAIPISVHSSPIAF